MWTFIQAGGVWGDGGIEAWKHWFRPVHLFHFFCPSMVSSTVELLLAATFASPIVSCLLFPPIGELNQSASENTIAFYTQLFWINNIEFSIFINK